MQYEIVGNAQQECSLRGLIDTNIDKKLSWQSMLILYLIILVCKTTENGSWYHYNVRSQRYSQLSIIMECQSLFYMNQSVEVTSMLMGHQLFYASHHCFQLNTNVRDCATKASAYWLMCRATGRTQTLRYISM